LDSFQIQLSESLASVMTLLRVLVTGKLPVRGGGLLSASWSTRNLAWFATRQVDQLAGL